MNYVSQTSRTNCGQACVATVLGISLADATEKVGHGWTTTGEELAAAIGVPSELVDGKPSGSIIALQYHEEPGGDRAHWTVYNKGEVFDPGFIGARLWKITKHIIVSR